MRITEKCSRELRLCFCPRGLPTPARRRQRLPNAGPSEGMKDVKNYRDEQRETGSGLGSEDNFVWKQLWGYLRWGIELERRSRSEAGSAKAAKRWDTKLIRDGTRRGLARRRVHGKSSCEIKLKRDTEKSGCSAKVLNILLERWQEMTEERGRKRSPIMKFSLFSISKVNETPVLFGKSTRLAYYSMANPSKPRIIAATVEKSPILWWLRNRSTDEMPFTEAFLIEILFMETVLFSTWTFPCG